MSLVRRQFSYFSSGNMCLYLNQDFCSQFIYATIKILGKHLQFVYVTLLKIDIPSLTDLDSMTNIDITSWIQLKLSWMRIRLVFRRLRVRSSSLQHYFVEMGHEIISTAILSLLMIQVRQLSITGERMCT